MKKSIQALLWIAGLIAITIGIGIMLFPVEFHATSGITLQGPASLMSEIRAPAGVLVVGGILIITGAYSAAMTFTSVVIGALIYLGYGVPRLISIALDGVPTPNLIAATAVELIGGAIFIWVAYRLYKKNPAASHFVA